MTDAKPKAGAVLPPELSVAANEPPSLPAKVIKRDGQPAAFELAKISKPWTSYAEADNFKQAYLGTLPLLHFTYSAINPVAVKSLMKAIGLPAGDLRKPLTGLAADALTKGVRIVQDLGLDKTYGYKVKSISAVAA